MKIDHPNVTLVDEARCGVVEDIRCGFAINLPFQINTLQTKHQ